MDTGSVNSVPSSVASNSSARSTPVQSHYKPLTQSASVLALTKSPDDEIKRKSPDELVHILRRLEGENRNLVIEHSNIMKDVNKKMQILLLEVRGLKDINQSLQDDNQELRDLCCFLDDDRQRGRKLAREWQRFGRYTASVMRSEVSAYQEKLKELEQKQQELISDNVDLKELCLYLDTERLRAGQTRDEGDGSSSSTVAGGDEPGTMAAGDTGGIDLVPIGQLHNNFSSGTTEYVRHLEDKVKQLEQEKKNISQQMESSPENDLPTSAVDPGDHQLAGGRRVGPDGNQYQDHGARSPNPNKPEAVVHAMKVLEVHENLERPATSVGEENLDDKEKAIVREMCNVVWRKLGNVSSEGDSEHSTPHPVYENIQPSRSRSTPPEPSSRQSQDRPPDRHTPHASRPHDSFHASRPHDTSHVSRPQDPGIGLEPMPVYTAQPVQPMQQSQRSDPNLHGGGNPQYSRSDQRQSTNPQSQYIPATRQAPPVSQSQRPSVSQGFPMEGSHQGQPAPPNPHQTSRATKYGYVRTTRSTPVTPTPSLRTHSPVPSTPTQSRLAQERSASPRVGQRPGMQQRSQSPGPQPRAQYPRTDSQSSSVPLYQNHPPLAGKGDNSYENIPHSYYYVTSSKGPNASTEGQQTVQQSSRGPGHDYAMGPQSHSGSRMSYSDQSARNAGAQSRGHNQPPPPASSSQGKQQYSTHPHYQNMQYRNPSAPGKQNVRDPSPQGSRSAQAPPYRPPQQPGAQYGQQYPPRSVSVSSAAGPPPQGQGPQYGGQHGAYMGYPEEGQAYRRQDGRGRQDGSQYY